MRPAGPVRVLGRAPLVWVGTLSYSLYLWHWPVLTLTEWALDDLTALQRTVLVLASVLPAWASHRFLESPVHHSRRLARRTRLALTTGATLSAAGALVALPLLTVGSPFRTTPPDGADPVSAALGARALDHQVSPDVLRARVDDPGLGHAGPAGGREGPTACRRRPLPGRPARDRAGARASSVSRGGRPRSPSSATPRRCSGCRPSRTPRRTRGWRIVTYGKSSCAFAAGHAALAGRPYQQCDTWNAKVMAALRADPPDLVVTSGFATAAWDHGAPSRAALVSGLAQRWQQVRGLGSALSSSSETARSRPNDLDVCAARHLHHLAACAFHRRAAVADSALPEQAEAARLSGTPLVDLTGRICPLACAPWRSATSPSTGPATT